MVNRRQNLMSIGMSSTVASQAFRLTFRVLNLGAAIFVIRVVNAISQRKR